MTFKALIEKLSLAFVLVYVIADAYEAGFTTVALLGCALFLAAVGEELRQYLAKS